MSQQTFMRLEQLRQKKNDVETLGEPCAVKIASTVRRGGVGAPEQSGPGLLPYSEQKAKAL